MTYPSTIFFCDSLQNNIFYREHQKDYQDQTNSFTNSKRHINRGHLISVFKKEYEKFLRIENIEEPFWSYKNDTIIQDKINDFIVGYVFRDLDNVQIDKIVVSYGFEKSLKLFHDFHVIKNYCNCSDFCGYLTNPNIKLNCCLVECILFNSIGITKSKTW